MHRIAVLEKNLDHVMRAGKLLQELSFKTYDKAIVAAAKASADAANAAIAAAGAASKQVARKPRPKQSKVNEREAILAKYIIRNVRPTSPGDILERSLVRGPVGGRSFCSPQG